MKNLFARFVSIACVLAMLFTVCPTVLADDAPLTAEAIAGSQATNAITEDMTLPTGYTWSSSNEDVIKIDGSTAKVNRPISSNATVTLTATPTPTTGGDAQTFEFTVLSKMANVLESGNFKDTTAADLGWKPTNSTPVSVKTDSTNGNSYLEIDLNDIGPEGKTYNHSGYRALTADEQAADELVVSFDFYYTPSSETESVTNMVDVWFGIAPNATGTENSASTANNFRAMRISGSTTAAPTVSYHGQGSTSEKLRTFQKDAWNRITMKINRADSTVAIMKDDGTWSGYKTGLAADKPNASTPTYNTTYYTGGKLTKLHIQRGSGLAKAGVFSIDNLAMYTESTDNLTNDEKKIYLDEGLTKSSITSDSAAAIRGTSLNLDTMDGLVSWSSSDKDIISDSGAVTKSTAMIAKPVTMTATMNGTDISKSFDFMVAPSTVQDLTFNYANGRLEEDFEGTILFDKTTNQGGEKSGCGKEYTLGINSADSLADAEQISFAQVTDSDKNGTVGQFTHTGEEIMNLGLYPGAYTSNLIAYFTAGVDFKYTPDAQAEASAFTWSISGVNDFVKMTFDYAADKIYVYHTNAAMKKVIDMTDETRAGNWVRLDAVFNIAGASQEVYINGNKLFELPMNTANTHSASDYLQNHPIRHMGFDMADKGVLLIDNAAILRVSSETTAVAGAGVERAIIDYNGESVNALPSATVVPGTHGLGTKVSSLTWSGKGVDGTSFAPNKIGEYDLTVTSTYSGQTKTGTVKVKGAPVFLNVTGNTAETMAVTATGATAGGKLIIITYNDAEQTEISNVTIHDNFNDVKINATNFRALFWNNMDGLKPLAYAVK